MSADDSRSRMMAIDSTSRQGPLPSTSKSREFLRFFAKTSSEGPLGQARGNLVLPTLILIGAALYFARDLFVPIALSMVLTIYLMPVVARFQRIGLNRVLSVITVVVVAFSVLGGLGLGVGTQLISLANDMDKYQNNIVEKVRAIRQAGEGGIIKEITKNFEEIAERIEEEKVEPGSPPEEADAPVPVRVESESGLSKELPAALGSVFDLLATAGVVITLVIFMLISREDLRSRFIRLIGYDRLATTTRALDEATERIGRYLITQSMINGVYGILFGLSTWAIGVPYALVWGVLAGVLRFIPYLGPVIAASLPMALSLATFPGWLWPLAVLLIIIVLELLCNLVLEPLLCAQSSGVSTVALLLAFVFWSWLWGPVGLVLAAPLTSCIVVMGKYVPGMSFLAVLMSDEPALEPSVTYYQRLLANDRFEARRIAKEYVSSHSTTELFENVFVPALILSKGNSETGQSELNVLEITREIVNELSDPENRASTSEPTDSQGEQEEWLAEIVACPAHDDADALALAMLAHMLGPEKIKLDLMGTDVLTSEIVSFVVERRATLVLISSLPPTGLARCRYLCKRLRSDIGEGKLNVVVGRFNFQADIDQEVLLSAGATYVETSLTETKNRVVRLVKSFSGLSSKVEKEKSNEPALTKNGPQPSSSARFHTSS